MGGDRVPADMMLAGVAGAARGLKGEVFVEVRTDRPDQVFAPGATLRVEGGPDAQELTVERTSMHGGRRIVKFAELGTREAVEALRGAELLTAAVEEDEAWYPEQLEGLAVVDLDGNPVGTVAGFSQGAAHDLLLVDVRGEQFMVPFVKALVPEVSLEEGRVVVDAIDGLFE